MRYINRRAAREKRELARELRRASTPEEKILWHHLRTNKLENLHFRRQHVLAGFIVDFYCAGAGLIIEVDGKHHEKQREADHQRDGILRGMGNEILRFPNTLIRNDLASVLKTIKEAVLHPNQPGVPPSPLRGRGTGG